MEEISQVAKEIIEKSALRSLGRREFSVWSLKKKLKEKFPANLSNIKDIIDKFVEKGWLSNERFCENLVREKATYSGWGEGKIIFKLKENKISEELISKYLDKYFGESIQIKKAHKLAIEKEAKLNFSYKKLSDYEKKQKIKLFLVSRGFSFDIAQKGIDIMEEL